MSDSVNILRWIMFAQRDYNAAHNMSVLHHPVPLEIVCYHCQQSVEKILKAYILARSDPLVKTHDLESILKQCMDHDNQFASFADICAVLTGYAIASRYPLDEDLIDEHDMATALENTKKILDFTRARLAELGYSTEGTTGDSSEMQ